ncbi:sugar ABC transporter permease [Ruania alkalisoli]|uniref:Sugar ABC transporter permease n=1 Tax=Ruania alkalisoli TaxID=2779775 RepID=A0A7M1SSX5_9MICO|nr:sugar ABC transporter permease [Ruania alkalisoli]QOR70595.1 sugar ABC transporter permease [Ruania alkalisoli]
MTNTVTHPQPTRTRSGTPAAKLTRGRLHRKERQAGWLLVAPAGLHVFIWVGLPLIVALILSFTRYELPAKPRFIGFENFVEAFGKESFRTAVLNTFIMTGVAVPVSMTIALCIALLLNQGLKGQGFFRTAVFMPHITATVAVAVVWLWIYNPDSTGLLNKAIEIFGIGPVSWLGYPDLALGSVIVMLIWQGIGIKMLIYLAALQGLPLDLDEAARIDGANVVQRFLHIKVPLLRPATFFVLVTSIIQSFQVFDQIFILTSGGPANATTVITYQIYLSAFEASRMGYASAQSIVLFTFLIFLAIFSRRVVGGTDAH